MALIPPGIHIRKEYDWACLLSDEFSARVWKCRSLNINTKVHLYQALVMSFCSKVRKHRPSSLPTWRHWRLFTWGVSDRYLIYAGGLMSPMQRCFSELVCQPFVTYLLLRHRRLSLFGHVARLDHGVPLHDALRLMLDTYEGRRPMATWWRPLGRPGNVNKVQEDANALPLSTLWRCEITTVMQRHNGRWW